MTTTGRYTPTEDQNEYTPITALYPQITETRTVHDLSQSKITACCLLCSILNYLCCPFLGIPALIFAILGTEAEKRGELEAAKSHAFHTKIFNIISIVLISLQLVFYIFLTLAALVGIVIPQMYIQK